ncbi:MAG: septum formation initiator family protein [Oscillospiraceae bacterium]|nr:septum formation initiator family protein [Oscillospiraceae bacterium]
MTLIKLQDRIEEAENARDALAVQARELQAGNAGLEYEISHSTDKETLEDVARTKLGFVLPGEIVFYNLND